MQGWLTWLPHFLGGANRFLSLLPDNKFRIRSDSCAGLLNRLVS